MLNYKQLIIYKKLNGFKYLPSIMFLHPVKSIKVFQTNMNNSI